MIPFKSVAKMTKFIAFMFVVAAVWLMVVLIATIRVADSTPDCLFGIGCARLMTTEYLEKKLPDLNVGGLQELGRRYAKRLVTKSDSMSYDEVNSTLMKLHEWDRQHDSFDLKSIKLSDSWRGLLRLRDIIDECSPAVEEVSKYVTTEKDNQYQQRFAFECLREYLEKCGFEERFGKIIDSIKQKSHQHRDSCKFPTLYSYLKAEIWPHISMNFGRYGIEFDLKWLLSAVRELPALGNISGESDCPVELTTNLLYWKANIERFANFFDDYFALYLDACGYEEQFERIIDGIKQPPKKSRISEAYPTLERYFRKRFSGEVFHGRGPIREELVKLLSVMKELTDETGHSSDSQSSLLKTMFEEIGKLPPPKKIVEKPATFSRPISSYPTSSSEVYLKGVATSGGWSASSMADAGGIY